MPRVPSPNMQGKSPVQNAEVKDCFPECFVSPLTSCAVCKNTSCNSWLIFRWRTRMLVEHRYFEWFILLTVLVSSLVLVRVALFAKISFLVWHWFRVVYVFYSNRAVCIRALVALRCVVRASRKNLSTTCNRLAQTSSR